MNKIVASIGMVAFGASALQTASAQDFGAEPNKFWSVTATLRGFYDDNVSTVPDGEDKTDSFGIEVAPGVGLKWDNDATAVTAGYRYSGKYYENAPDNRVDHWSHTHSFRLALDHAFSERYRLGLSDSFVIGQEPDSIRLESGASDQFQRLSGNNIRNYASIFFNAQLTPLFSTEVGYNNSFFDYDAEFNDAIQTPGFPVIPSPSGALDRVEHTGYIEGQLEVRPTTLALVGYQFGVVDYTGDEAIRGAYLGTTQSSDVRNSRSHYGYVGLSHSFRPDFSGSLRVGVQHIDFYNTSEDGFSPYVQAMLNYAYAPESSLRVGFTHRRSPIYVTSADDADTSVVFGSIYHRIVPNLFGSLTGTFQNSIYNGGDFDGDSDQLFQVGVNLEYRFNRHLSAEIGYNYDHLNSDAIDRDYDRNRVYIGLIASY
jgi:hypothetical protein